jgi:hypothetical protein
VGRRWYRLYIQVFALRSSNPNPTLRATPTTAGGNAKCRSFESEKDLFAFLLNFSQLRLECTSSVFLSDEKAADLGFVDC